MNYMDSGIGHIGINCSLECKEWKKYKYAYERLYKTFHGNDVYNVEFRKLMRNVLRQIEKELRE